MNQVTATCQRCGGTFMWDFSYPRWCDECRVATTRGNMRLVKSDKAKVEEQPEENASC